MKNFITLIDHSPENLTSWLFISQLPPTLLISSTNYQQINDQTDRMLVSKNSGNYKLVQLKNKN